MSSFDAWLSIEQSQSCGVTFIVATRCNYLPLHEIWPSHRVASRVNQDQRTPCPLWTEKCPIILEDEMGSMTSCLTKKSSWLSVLHSLCGYLMSTNWLDYIRKVCHPWIKHVYSVLKAWIHSALSNLVWLEPQLSTNHGINIIYNTSWKLVQTAPKMFVSGNEMNSNEYQICAIF